MRNPVAIWMPAVLVGYGVGLLVVGGDGLTAFCAFMAALVLCELGLRWHVRRAPLPAGSLAMGKYAVSFWPDGRATFEDVPDYEWLSAGIEAQLRADRGHPEHPATSEFHDDVLVDRLPRPARTHQSAYVARAYRFPRWP